MPELKGNDLISGEEIAAVRARAKTITMQDALRATMEGNVVLITPMPLTSGFCVTFSIIESGPQNLLELCSIGLSGSRKLPDPADAEHIAAAILGKGYNPITGRMSINMLHYWKRRE